MRDHERAMLAYAMLAELSGQKRQMQGRDKFLILAAAAACRAGWPLVADRCQVLVLNNNSAHLIGRFKVVTDAMRDDEFELFLKQLERFCSYERAEHLLSELDIEPKASASDVRKPTGEYVLEILSGPVR